jgi:hypothetical protein
MADLEFDGETTIDREASAMNIEMTTLSPEGGLRPLLDVTIDEEDVPGDENVPGDVVDDKVDSHDPHVTWFLSISICCFFFI